MFETFDMFEIIYLKSGCIIVLFLEYSPKFVFKRFWFQHLYNRKYKT